MNTTIAPRTPKQERSAQFSMGFSCIGHTYAHLFTPIFFTLVPLALEDEFGLSHGETVALIFVGNLLFGVAAPLAGWLADRQVPAMATAMPRTTPEASIAPSDSKTESSPELRISLIQVGVIVH